MRSNRLTTSFAVLATMFALACGSDDSVSEPTVDRQSAALLVGEATTRAQLDVDSVRTNASTGEAVASFSCSNGGTAAAAGAVNIAAEPLTVDVDVALDYVGCMTNQNVIIDGSLDFSQEVIVGGEQLLYVQTILVGSAQFSGAYEASCDIDLNVTLDSSTGAVVMMEGTACGYRADELNLAVRKNW
jgi:hypothetical protein